MTAPAPASASRLRLAGSLGRGTVLALFSALLVLYVAGPVGWLVSSSLQAESEITAVPPNWVPPHPTLGNFAAIFGAGKRAVTYENRWRGDAATGRFLPSGAENLLPSLKQALKDRCSMGEACGAMRDVFGEYQPTF